MGCGWMECVGGWVVVVGRRSGGRFVAVGCTMAVAWAIYVARERGMVRRPDLDQVVRCVYRR